MALTMNPEEGVKLTKKDKGRVAKKIKNGWKGKVSIPDYIMKEDGNIYINSNKNRISVKIIKVKEDGIYIEKALKNKSLRIKWIDIGTIQPSKKMKKSIEVILKDGKVITFEVYESFKIQQITEYIIKYAGRKIEELKNEEINIIYN